MSHKSSKKPLLSVANTALQVVTAGGSVAFNIVGLRKDVKFFPGGPSAVIKESGKYAYNFKVTGTPDNVGLPNVLCLSVNGVNVSATCSPEDGSGIVSFRRGDLVQLQLDADSPGGNMTLDSTPLAGAATAALTLTFIER